MSSKKVLTPAMIKVLTALASGYIRLVGKTSHWEVRGSEPVWELLRAGKAVIFAFWHNRFVMMPYIYCSYFRKERIAVIVSQSRDGELVGRFIQRFGLHPVRGSSSRGGLTALLNLARNLKGGWDVAVTPDGPRGPRYQVQDGIVALASITGAPIVPVSYSSNLQLLFRKSWDHMRLPLLFARISVVFSPPILIEKGISKKKRLVLLQELGERLRKADREAEKG